MADPLFSNYSDVFELGDFSLGFIGAIWHFLAA